MRNLCISIFGVSGHVTAVLETANNGLVSTGISRYISIEIIFKTSNTLSSYHLAMAVSCLPQRGQFVSFFYSFFSPLFCFPNFFLLFYTVNSIDTSNLPSFRYW